MCFNFLTVFMINLYCYNDVIKAHEEITALKAISRIFHWRVHVMTCDTLFCIYLGLKREHIRP